MRDSLAKGCSGDAALAVLAAVFPGNGHDPSGSREQSIDRAHDLVLGQKESRSPSVRVNGGKGATRATEIAGPPCNGRMAWAQDNAAIETSAEKFCSS